jgi:hypothetical protein
MTLDEITQSAAPDDERAAFEKWFNAEVAAERLYAADEEMAWAGWHARAAQAAVAMSALTPAQWVDVYYFARATDIREFVERAQTVFDATPPKS